MIMSFLIVNYFCAKQVSVIRYLPSPDGRTHCPTGAIDSVQLDELLKKLITVN
jgi:hypothetical protein